MESAEPESQSASSDEKIALAQLELAGSTFFAAKRKFEGQQRLFDKEYITQAELDAAKIELQKADLEFLSARLSMQSPKQAKDSSAVQELQQGRVRLAEMVLVVAKREFTKKQHLFDREFITEGDLDVARIALQKAELDLQIVRSKGESSEESEVSSEGFSMNSDYLHNKNLAAEDDPLRKLVNVDFKDMDLANVIALLAKKGGMNVIAGTEIEGEVTASWNDIALGRTIELSLAMNDYGIVEESGIYRIVSLEEAARIREEQARGEHPRGFTLYNKDMTEEDDPLRKLVNIDFKDMELSNVLKLLTEKGKIEVVSDDIEGNVTANLKDIPLGRAIEIILRMNGLGIIEKYDGFRRKWHVVPYEDAVEQSRKKRKDAEAPADESPTLIDETQAKAVLAADSTDTTQEIQNVQVGGAIRIRDDAGGPSERMREKLQQPVGVVFEKIHIVNLAKVLQDNYDLNIAIDWSVVAPVDSDSPDDYVSDGIVEYVNLKNVTLQQALMAFLRPLGLVPEIEGNIITITSPERLSSAHEIQNAEVGGPNRVRSEASGPSERMREILQQPVGVVFEKVHIVDLFKVLQDNYDVNIAINWSVVAPADSDSPDEYVNLTNVTLQQALMAILRPLNLAPMIEGDIITITTPKKITENNVAHLNAGPGPQPKYSKTEALLATLVTIDFGNSPPLSRVLEMLADETDINIMIDNRVVAPAPGEKRGTPDTVITDGILPGEWHFSDVRLRVVLKNALDTLGLTYTVQDGFIWITSPENARHESFEDLETREYDLPHRFGPS